MRYESYRNGDELGRLTVHTGMKLTYKSFVWPTVLIRIFTIFFWLLDNCKESRSKNFVLTVITEKTGK